mmetsp:Transcript_7046/g.13771  ORF Transcript_7046/g.13771 Transcript_7046/m.13771 type:complete len:100 (-) Transcript_7046:1533-1832(-)
MGTCGSARHVTVLGMWRCQRKNFIESFTKCPKARPTTYPPTGVSRLAAPLSVQLSKRHAAASVVVLMLRICLFIKLTIILLIYALLLLCVADKEWRIQR